MIGKVEFVWFRSPMTAILDDRCRWRCMGSEAVTGLLNRLHPVEGRPGVPRADAARVQLQAVARRLNGSAQVLERRPALPARPPGDRPSSVRLWARPVA